MTAEAVSSSSLWMWTQKSLLSTAIAAACYLGSAFGRDLGTYAVCLATFQSVLKPSLGEIVVFLLSQSEIKQTGWAQSKLPPWWAQYADAVSSSISKPLQAAGWQIHQAGFLFFFNSMTSPHCFKPNSSLFSISKPPQKRWSINKAL